MNSDTRIIAFLLNISLELAVKVQDQMSCNGVDFSECSKRKFNAEAKIAAQQICVH